MKLTIYIISVLGITFGYSFFLLYNKQNVLTQLNEKYRISHISQIDSEDICKDETSIVFHNWSTKLFRGTKNSFMEVLLQNDYYLLASIEHHPTVATAAIDKHEACIQEILNNRMGLLDTESPNSENSSHGKRLKVPIVIKFERNNSFPLEKKCKTTISIHSEKQLDS
jgi:hypothetical protein